MIIQIYEIQTPKDAEACVSAGVNHIGSVLLNRDDWRDPVLRETLQVSAAAEARSSLIPLFGDMKTLALAIDYYRPDYIHFCDSLIDAEGGPINPEPFVRLQSELGDKFPDTGIIRSIPIPKRGALNDFPVLDIAAPFKDTSDAFLTDTWVPQAPVAGYIGITGEPSDWDMAADLTRWSPIPVILAGGLSPGNVYEALLEAKCAGADSCTQTNRVDKERNPVRFEKDFKKVAEFVREVRRAETALNEKKKALETRLMELRSALADREKALPAHSVRPHQIMVIESLEEEIDATEGALAQFRTESLDDSDPSSPDSIYSEDRTAS